MKVKELKELIAKLDDNEDVFVTTDYSDYHACVAVDKLTSAAVQELYYNEDVFSWTLFEFPEDKDEYGPDAQFRTAVVLS